MIACINSVAESYCSGRHQVTSRKQVLKFLQQFLHCCSLFFIKPSRFSKIDWGDVVVGKSLRTSNDIHHWLTVAITTPLSMVLGLWSVQIQEFEQDAASFLNQRCGRHKDTCLGNLARKVRYGV
ncbi:hypothetical protein AVEN_129060-1 [Araneus ventricosus]|uniref:Uncharacterized protein n=1 Tax=Araneus ventricosus TaxID=182803 RepID=A0A4Y2TQD0_ARAVE|nr:hypothetical protein AVEN_129060-1 [Araneus ventricosus]